MRSRTRCPLPSGRTAASHPSLAAGHRSPPPPTRQTARTARQRKPESQLKDTQAGSLGQPLDSLPEEVEIYKQTLETQVYYLTLMDFYDLCGLFNVLWLFFCVYLLRDNRRKLTLEQQSLNSL